MDSLERQLSDMKATVSIGQEEIKAEISAIWASIDQQTQSLCQELDMGNPRSTT
jgi:hypothetical protein